MTSVIKLLAGSTELQLHLDSMKNVDLEADNGLSDDDNQALIEFLKNF
jgi:hypothetical protein